VVAAAVSVSLVAGIVPLVAGVGLELGLRSMTLTATGAFGAGTPAPGTEDRLLVYHFFFAIAATIQAVNWWPARGFGPDRG
jgi:hypothetical protein